MGHDDPWHEQHGALTRGIPCGTHRIPRCTWAVLNQAAAGFDQIVGRFGLHQADCWGWNQLDVGRSRPNSGWDRPQPASCTPQSKGLSRPNLGRDRPTKNKLPHTTSKPVSENWSGRHWGAAYRGRSKARKTGVKQEGERIERPYTVIAIGDWALEQWERVWAETGRASFEPFGSGSEIGVRGSGLDKSCARILRERRKLKRTRAGPQDRFEAGNAPFSNTRATLARRSRGSRAGAARTPLGLPRVSRPKRTAGRKTKRLRQALSAIHTSISRQVSTDQPHAPSLDATAPAGPGTRAKPRGRRLYPQSPDPRIVRGAHLAHGAMSV